MKKGKVFFHPIEGSAPLTISWSSMPKGDAIEAIHGDGVVFFSDKGDLLCVIFDDIREDEDHQSLEFAEYLVEVNVSAGKIGYNVTKKEKKAIPKAKEYFSEKKELENPALKEEIQELLLTKAVYK